VRRETCFTSVNVSPENGAIMAKAGIGYAIMLDKLVSTDNSSDIIFRPLKEAPKAEMFIIWRKNQVFTPR